MSFKIKALIFLALLFISVSNIFGEEIIILPIKGVIDLGLSAFVRRTVKDAEDKGVKTIVIEMDTPGGRVDAADIICEELMHYRGETITYILNWAWSAGSMISLATDRIIMAPGSSIGSAEPRMGLSTQETKDEKMVSALRARFKAIAEEKGHNPALAQAMVDKDLIVKYVEINRKRLILTQPELEEKIARFGEENIKVISTISEKGKLLNLSYKDAEKYHLAEAICKDRETLLAYLNKIDARIIEKQPTWSETLVRFITHPITSSLLLGIGFWAIILALRMPGLGAPEIVGILSILLFFWGHKLAGLAQWMDLFLILLGIMLILIEIFIIPGFGIVGITGILCLIGGIILIIIRHPIQPPLEAIERASNIVLSSFLITGILFFLSIKFIPATKLFGKLILETKTNSRIESKKIKDMEGFAISDLRPSGKAKFGNKIYDVQTDGEYIKKGEKIKIISIFGNIIKVRKL